FRKGNSNRTFVTSAVGDLFHQQQHNPDVSDHFDGARFFNPTGVAGQPFSAVPKMLREPRTRWPRRVDTPTRKPAALGDAAATISFIGHSSFLIQTRSGNLLTDPMY